MDTTTQKEFLRAAFDSSWLGIILKNIERMLVAIILATIFLSAIGVDPSKNESSARSYYAMLLYSIFIVCVFSSVIPQSFFVSRICKPTQKMITKYKARKRKQLLQYIEFAENRIHNNKKYIAECQTDLKELENL